MPIKIFAAPGDHRDDFEKVETQINEWAGRTGAKIIDLHCAVNMLPEKRDVGAFMLTVVVHHE